MDNEEIKETANDIDQENRTEEMDKTPVKQRGKFKALFVIVLLVVAVVIAGGYFIYEKKDSQKAQFYISASDIVESNNIIENSRFSRGDNVFFFFKLKRNNLNSEVCILEIEYQKEGVFSYYKRITYEIAREYPYLKSSIPSVYFSRDGDYKIKVILDGRPAAEKQITFATP